MFVSSKKVFPVSSAIQDIFDSFQYLKVLVIGDVMIDEYIWGNISRISPEAPVPLVDVYRHESRLGGAANVALNLSQLGATPMLLSVVGDDERGHQFKELLHHHHLSSANIILDQDRHTTVKTRVIARNQQLLRYDSEMTESLSPQVELSLIDLAIDAIYTHNPHVVILQDYNKGVLTPLIISNIIANARQSGIPIAVDPKKDNFFAYKGCTLFKPNLREAVNGTELMMSASQPDTLIAGAEYIRSVLENEYTVITLSEKGMFLHTPHEAEIIPAYLRRIVDVSGAGDTVISLLALGLALKLDIFATVELANIAAGLVCEHVGVTAINRDELLNEAQRFLA